MTIKKLTQYSVLHVTGEDAETFLQGQLSQDVAALDNSWAYAGYCNPKGRLIALMQIWRLDNGFRLLLDSSLVDGVVKRLKMYVLRSKVEIEQGNEHAYGFHSKDGETTELLKTFNCEDQLDRTVQSVGNIRSMSLLNYETRCLLVANDSELGQMLDTQTISSLSANQWADINISEGIPTISDQTTELFVPQMVNLDLLGGINFKKGCYTGQEIVARMHYLGKLKQRMYLVKKEVNGSATDQARPQPIPGEKVFITSELTGNGGQIVSVSDHSDTLLAVLRIETADNTLYTEGGVSLKVSSSQPISFN